MKRFGRNQRRKLREQVAALEAAGADLARSTKELVVEKRVLQDRLIEWARSIHSQLGPEHPFNEDIAEMLQGYLPRLVEFTRFVEQPRASFHQRVGVSLACGSVALRYVNAVTHLVELYPDRVDYTIRVVLRGPDDASAYLIDLRELQKGRSDPRFVKWIAAEIARKLGHHLAKRAA